MRRALARTALPLLVAPLLAALPAAPAAAASMISSGPLTNITVTPDLGCGVNHDGDPYAEFWSWSACGTFAAVNGTLYRPARVPGATFAAPSSAYAPVSQTAVTGAGTTANPYRVTTVVDAGSSRVRLTQTDTYVTGQEGYRTDVAVSNIGATAANVVLYRAGDCHFGGPDLGYGRTGTGGSVACAEGTAPSARLMRWTPVTPGSSYYEATPAQVWAALDTHAALPGTCRCADHIDAAAALGWTLTVPPGATATVSSVLDFPGVHYDVGITQRTVTSPVAETGTVVPYEVTFTNPNHLPVTLTSVVDDLPAGFAYLAGRTSGLTTANPAVSGQRLTWTGSWTLPARGSAVLRFDAKVVSAPPGTYPNTVSATSPEAVVTPSTGAAVRVVIQTRLEARDWTVPELPSLPSRVLEARLTVAATGAPLAGRDVEFRGESGGVLCVSVTDASGLATCPQPSPPQQSYGVTRDCVWYWVQYRGDATYTEAGDMGCAVRPPV